MNRKQALAAIEKEGEAGTITKAFEIYEATRGVGYPAFMAAWETGKAKRSETDDDRTNQ